MHFDQRTQQALREAGLDADERRAVSERVVELVDEAAMELRAFFDEHDVVYSDMDMAHSASDYPEHRVERIDLFTHAEAIRGWLRFPNWGVYVEGGRTLEDGTVELTLGPTIHDRVRFASTRGDLE